MNRNQYPLICLLCFASGIALQACVHPDDGQPTECYVSDPNGDWPLNPIVFVDNYCGSGGTAVDDPFEARYAIWCVDEPSTGCEPCVRDAAAADIGLRGEISKIYTEAGCPSDYEPEEFIRGCYSPMPELARCCYTAQYVTDTRVCTLPQGEVP